MAEVGIRSSKDSRDKPSMANNSTRTRASARLEDKGSHEAASFHRLLLDRVLKTHRTRSASQPSQMGLNIRRRSLQEEHLHLNKTGLDLVPNKSVDKAFKARASLVLALWVNQSRVQPNE